MVGSNRNDSGALQTGLNFEHVRRGLKDMERYILDKLV